MSAEPSAKTYVYTLPDEGVDLERLLHSLVLQAMERAGGNKTKAAKLLGITRDQIRYRLKKGA